MNTNKSAPKSPNWTVEEQQPIQYVISNDAIAEMIEVMFGPKLRFHKKLRKAGIKINQSVLPSL